MQPRWCVLGAAGCGLHAGPPACAPGDVSAHLTRPACMPSAPAAAQRWRSRPPGTAVALQTGASTRPQDTHTHAHTHTHAQASGQRQRRVRARPVAAGWLLRIMSHFTADLRRLWPPTAPQAAIGCGGPPICCCAPAPVHRPRSACARATMAMATAGYAYCVRSRDRASPAGAAAVADGGDCCSGRCRRPDGAQWLSRVTKVC
jgi:hypothetical protein